MRHAFIIRRLICKTEQIVGRYIEKSAYKKEGIYARNALPLFIIGNALLGNVCRLRKFHLLRPRKFKTFVKSLLKFRYIFHIKYYSQKVS